MPSIISDYHTHPLAHDPHRKYTEELLEEWVSVAEEQKIREIVFTDHDRYHQGIDFEAFEKVRDKNAERVILMMGIELDNDPESSVAGRKWTEKNYDRLDYILGSIHFIGDWAYDHPDFMKEYDKWNIDILYKTYFTEIQRIASDDIYDCLSHLDLIKIFRFFPKNDISSIIDETLDTIARHDRVIELNTAGWHKPIEEQYPSLDILKKAREKKIRITVSSDAHAPAHLGRDFGKASEILKEAGYTEMVRFKGHKATMHPL